MRKNPYTNLSVINFDQRSEAILKKAMVYGVDIFENKILAKKLLNSPQKNHPKNIYNLFIWILEQEKKTQMSS